MLLSNLSETAMLKGWLKPPIVEVKHHYKERNTYSQICIRLIQNYLRRAPLMTSSDMGSWTAIIQSNQTYQRMNKKEIWMEVQFVIKFPCQSCLASTGPSFIVKTSSQWIKPIWGRILSPKKIWKMMMLIWL